MKEKRNTKPRERKNETKIEKWRKKFKQLKKGRKQDKVQKGNETKYNKEQRKKKV